MTTHLAYIQRDATGRDGSPGVAYGRDGADVDPADFERRSADDRHQFRIIVAPEDGEAIGDLSAFTRDLMTQVETDVGTRLDWIAVDHHDTGHPHSHVVLRGTDATGQDLVIAGDYIGHGMRHRAGELATTWLGPRTEREIAASVDREIVADRWTGLDHRLTRLARNGALTVDELDPFLRGRLQHLERLGLAQPEASGWRLARDMPERLRALGERGDIVRTLQRTLGADRRDLATEPAAETPVLGRIIAKGLRDELSDAGWIAIDGIDGRAHYRPLPQGMALADWPVGAIVEHRPATPTLDQAIQAAARDGFVTIEDGGPLDDRHRRRLEALRREGVTERLSHRQWRVPDDLVAHGRRHDLARGGHLELRSPVGLDVQVRAVGATWLDGHIAEPPAGTAPTGFGAELLRARDARLGELEARGCVERVAGRMTIRRDRLEALRGQDLRETAEEISRETGLIHRPHQSGTLRGTYVGAVDRPSGRFAMIDDGQGGFALVPWRPIVEPRRGEQIGLNVAEGRVTWLLDRGPSR